MNARVGLRFLPFLMMLILFWSQGTLNAAAAENASVSDALQQAMRSAHLPEPLFPTKPTNADEDRDLAQALVSYGSRIKADDLSSLTAFVAGHSDSGWSSAVLTNLGIVYLHYGYFSRALDAWQKAWRDGKDATDPQIRALVDRAVGELARLDASLGRNDELAKLFDEIGTRAVSGSATEGVQSAREELDLAAKDPRHLYL